MKDIAHFEQVKAQNKRSLKNLLRETGWSGKSQLAKASGLSFPTVSSLLNELMEQGEVISEQNGISNGGRPAVSYKLDPVFQYAACAMLERQKLNLLIYDYDLKSVKGQEIPGFLWKEETEGAPAHLEMPLKKEITLVQLGNIFQKITERYPMLRYIAFGIPGVIQEGIITFLPIYPELEKQNVKKYLQEVTGAEMFLENDVNSIILAEKEEYPDMMHIMMKEKCIGSAILLNGELVHGAHGGAGELGMICQESEPSVELLVYLIRIIQSILDLPVIVFSGDDVKEHRLREVRKKLKEALPKERIPEIYYKENFIELYKKGLEGMIKEQWERN